MNTHKSRILLRRLALGLTLSALVAFAQSVNSSTLSPASASAPSAALSASEAVAQMKSTIESQNSFALKTRVTQIDGVTGKPVSTFESTILRAKQQFTNDTRITGAPDPSYPARILSVFDGKFYYLYAQGKPNAVRMDTSRLTTDQREEFLKSAIPPALPSLASGSGVLRQEAIERKLYDVVYADHLENDCMGFRKFTLQITAETHLPRRLEAEFQMEVSSRESSSGAAANLRPVFLTIEYLDWSLGVPAPAGRFGFTPPAGVRIEDKDPTQSPAALAAQPACPGCPVMNFQSFMKVFRADLQKRMDDGKTSQ